MGTYGALAHTCWVGGYDLGPDLNSMSMPIEYEELVDTRFGMTGQSRKAGFESVSASVAGYQQLGSGLVEATLWSQMSTTTQPVTMTSDGTVGQVAYFWQARHFKLTPFDGEVGSMAPFALEMKGVRGNGTLSVGAVRGRVLVAKGDISATGVAGSAYQLGAVASGEYIYLALHTFAIGTSFTFDLESDDNSNFTSATTRATVGAISSTGGTWMTRVAGPITDDYWRINVTAATGTSTIAVSAGIK